MRNRKNQKGFTLIELMIVIAIIGILMAYAIPAYRDYTVRAIRGDCNAIADGLKTPMAEFYYTNGAWPTAMTDLNLSSVTNDHVASVATNTGNIACTVQAAGDGGTVEWQATYAAGDMAVIWDCTDSLGLASPRNVCP